MFPLAIETADTFARNRIALVGEAAHVVPPIGAQGLNLGLRDAATLAELVADAHRQKRDVGASDLLARYDARRRADVMSRSIAVDVLNRSLLTDFIPAQGVRGLSLFLLDRIGPLRRALMREGVTPAAVAAAPDARRNGVSDSHWLGTAAVKIGLAGSCPSPTVGSMKGPAVPQSKNSQRMFA